MLLPAAAAGQPYTLSTMTQTVMQVQLLGRTNAECAPFCYLSPLMDKIPDAEEELSVGVARHLAKREFEL